MRILSTALAEQCLQSHGLLNCHIILKMEAARSYEMMVSYITTQCNNSENHDVSLCPCDNLKSCTIVFMKFGIYNNAFIIMRL